MNFKKRLISFATALVIMWVYIGLLWFTLANVADRPLLVAAVLSIAAAAWVAL